MTKFENNSTRRPVKAVNLDNKSGSFLRDKVITSEFSSILLLISRKILSTLPQKCKMHKVKSYDNRQPREIHDQSNK